MERNTKCLKLSTALYQVSTATALVEGIYQGAVRVGTLREHGDQAIVHPDALN
jgi:alpha-acetolactate decarboxylase